MPVWGWDYDSQATSVPITFQPSGIKALATKLAATKREVAPIIKRKVHVRQDCDAENRRRPTAKVQKLTQSWAPQVVKLMTPTTQLNQLIQNTLAGRARIGRVTRAKFTQIYLLSLEPQIQEKILLPLTQTAGRNHIIEKLLRAIVAISA